jgi:hypothetical protein
MMRIIGLSSLVTSAVWLVLSTAALLIAVPAVVEAQVNQMTAGALTVGGAAANGLPVCGQTPSAQVATGCGGSIVITSANGNALVALAPASIGAGGGALAQQTGSVQVFAADGNARVRLTNGVARKDDGSLDPASAGVSVQYPDGATTLARIGTMEYAHPAGVAAGNPAIYLKDSDGNVRFMAILDDTGSASIRILDASGNVTWSAP